jgi:hypothetical protein
VLYAYLRVIVVGAHQTGACDTRRDQRISSVERVDCFEDVIEDIYNDAKPCRTPRQASRVGERAHRV